MGAAGRWELKDPALSGVEQLFGAAGHGKRATQPISSHLASQPQALVPTQPSRPAHNLFEHIDPQAESTLVVDSAMSVKSPYRAPRRPGHADMNLLTARHDDPYHHSALIELGQLNASSSQSWLVILVGLFGAGVLVALFFFV